MLSDSTCVVCRLAFCQIMEKMSIRTFFELQQDVGFFDLHVSKKIAALIWTMLRTYLFADCQSFLEREEAKEMLQHAVEPMALLI